MPSCADVDRTRVAWRISTRSGSGGGNCVEAGPIRDGSGRVAVRHSYERGGGMLAYSRAQWAAFLSGVKDGDFDF